MLQPSCGLLRYSAKNTQIEPRSKTALWLAEYGPLEVYKSGLGLFALNPTASSTSQPREFRGYPYNHNLESEGESMVTRVRVSTS